MTKRRRLKEKSLTKRCLGVSALKIAQLLDPQRRMQESGLMAIAVHDRLAFNEVASTCEKAKENEFEMKLEIYSVASESARPREMMDRK